MIDDTIYLKILKDNGSHTQLAARLQANPSNCSPVSYSSASERGVGEVDTRTGRFP
ncbi:Hypothetical predicted protein, partial [Olea europaea subsp. europaea]